MSVTSLRTIEPGVVEVTMQDRENKNMFSKALIDGLTEAFAQIRADTHVRVAILTGYDTYFCSGGTREGLLSLQAGSGKFTDMGIYSLPLECEIPVIAAMQGHGIGGGFVFGLFADATVLSREGVYTANFMKYGFTPGMGATLMLPRKLGIALAEEMLFSARTYRGGELEKRGVPFPVLPRADVLGFARELAHEMAEKPRDALVNLKTHLVQELRVQLPAIVERELALHEKTFHQPEVKERIQTTFGV
jgi:4-carboxy-3-alkylbut-2-enoyl-[acp] decarboxylase